MVRVSYKSTWPRARAPPPTGVGARATAGHATVRKGARVSIPGPPRKTPGRSPTLCALLVFYRRRPDTPAQAARSARSPIGARRPNLCSRSVWVPAQERFGGGGWVAGVECASAIGVQNTLAWVCVLGVRSIGRLTRSPGSPTRRPEWGLPIAGRSHTHTQPTEQESGRAAASRACDLEHFAEHRGISMDRKDLLICSQPPYPLSYVPNWQRSVCLT